MYVLIGQQFSEIIYSFPKAIDNFESFQTNADSYIKNLFMW